MVGKNNSVVSRLKENLPNITIFGCNCYTFDLIASSAAKKITIKYEDFTRYVLNLFGSRYLIYLTI